MTARVARLEAAKDERRQKRKRSVKGTATLRQAFLACQNDAAGMECKNELVALQDACDKTGVFADLQDCIQAR